MSAGRLLDHVHIRSSNLEASRRFYRAGIEALGLARLIDEGPRHFSAGELWVDQAEGASSRVHIAFVAPSREAVARFHQAVIAAGGHDNGTAGERPYHPAYYAAFALDPDGNNVEAVHHGMVTRFEGSK